MSGPGTSTEPMGARRSSSAPISAPIQAHSASVEQTRELGEKLGGLLAPGDVVLLVGDLGAGKTAFTQGIGAGLDIRAVINSPTFTILKEYMGRLPLYHFDLYRIESPDEVYSLGFEDYFSGDGVCIVEWAERGEPHETDERSPWPASHLRVTFRADGPDSRVITAAGAGPRGVELQSAWAKAMVEER